jgi:hypothetical protein
VLFNRYASNELSIGRGRLLFNDSYAVFSISKLNKSSLKPERIGSATDGVLLCYTHPRGFAYHVHGIPLGISAVSFDYGLTPPCVISRPVSYIVHGVYWSGREWINAPSPPPPRFASSSPRLIIILCVCFASASARCLALLCFFLFCGFFAVP